MQGFMSGEASMRWSRRTSMTHFRAALLGSALVFPLALSANAMTLQEAVQQAIATNPDIGIVASNREAVDQELRQARGLYLPQIVIAGLTPIIIFAFLGLLWLAAGAIVGFGIRAVVGEPQPANLHGPAS